MKLMRHADHKKPTEQETKWGIKNITSIRKILIAIVLALLSTVQATFALYHSLDPITIVYHEIYRELSYYALGAAIVFLLYFGIIILVKHHLVVLGIVTGCITLISVINYYEILLHGTVLTIQDIKNITTAMNQLGNYSIQLTTTIAKILFSYAVILLIFAVVYSGNIPVLYHRKTGIITVCILAVLSFVLFLAPFSLIRARSWSWEVAYYEHGFAVGTLENIWRSMQGVTKPEGYNVAEIEDVTGIPGEIESQNYPDIILILDETYFDMDHLIDFNTDISYMENYDALDAYKGYATIPMIGGGTNASEFELLTSNSMMLLNTSTPFNDMDMTDSRNIAEYLEKLGYTTMAAHSQPSGNYHRGDAWPALGFDVTHFDKDFSGLYFYGRRYSASDSSLFNNFTRFYEEMPVDQPRFAYLLTIQNHGGWDRNDPDMDLVLIQNNRGLGEYEQQINEYLTCIKQTDDFIGELETYFSGIDRDVVVIMVGDHGPALLKQWDLGEENDLLKRQVPYFIWSNSELFMDSLPADSDIDMCALIPLGLKAAGLPLSPYYAELVRLSEFSASLTGVIVKYEKVGEIVYYNKSAEVEDVYGENTEADIVKKYYYMEYNRLKKKERIEQLYDPWEINTVMN